MSINLTSKTVHCNSFVHKLEAYTYSHMYNGGCYSSVSVPLREKEEWRCVRMELGDSLQ